MLRFGFFLLCSALFSLLLRLGFEAGRWITDKKGVFKVIEYLRSVFFFLMVASTRTYIFHNLRRNLQLVYLVNKRRSGVGLHIKYVNSMRVECRHDEAISFLVWISVTAERKSVNVRKVFSVLVKILGILYLQRSRQWLRTASLFWPENGSVSKIIFLKDYFLQMVWAGEPHSSHFYSIILLIVILFIHESGMFIDSSTHKFVSSFLRSISFTVALIYYSCFQFISFFIISQSIIFSSFSVFFTSSLYRVTCSPAASIPSTVMQLVSQKRNRQAMDNLLNRPQRE